MYENQTPSGTQEVDTKSNGSILKPYSLGQAAANLQVGQTELMVVPTEKFTHIDGEVTDNVETKTTSGMDASGNNYSDNVDSSLAVKCKWLSRDSWLKFPGLIRRGEYVQIWRVGDTDQYYYEVLGLSNHLRRKDIMLIVVSNTTDESVTELTPHNSVMFELNTADGHIVLKTPTNDGEPTGWTIQISMKEGNFFVSDDVGDSVLIDAVNSLIQAKNAADTEVRLDQDKMYLKANTSIDIVTDTLNIEANTINATGDSANWKYSTTDMSGSNISINYGNIGLSGTMTGSGDMNFGGGALTHEGINVGNSHTHEGVHGTTSGPK